MSRKAFLKGSNESDDIASVASYYREGAAILFGDGPIAGGRDEIETLFARTFGIRGRKHDADPGRGWFQRLRRHDHDEWTGDHR